MSTVPVERELPELLALRVHLAAAAQRVYDEWEQDENGEDPDLGVGGICQDIAAAMAEVITASGLECTEMSAQVGEQHVFVVCRLDSGVYEVDINPYLYETGGGYTWRKRRGVELSSADVSIFRLSSDPADFEEMISMA